MSRNIFNAFDGRRLLFELRIYTSIRPRSSGSDHLYGDPHSVLVHDVSVRTLRPRPIDTYLLLSHFHVGLIHHTKWKKIDVLAVFRACIPPNK